MKGDEHNHHDLESTWTRHSSSAGVQSSSSQSTATADPYQTGMSYYTHAAHMFPYSANDLQPSSQPWSNGEPITFLGSYGTADHNAAVAVGHSAHSSHYTAMDAMFGSQSTYGFGSPFNAFFPSATSTDPFWGNSTAAVSKATRTLGGYATRMHDTTATADPYGYGGPHDAYAATANAMTAADTHEALSLKHIDAGMSALTLDHIKVSDQFAPKTMHGAFSSTMSSDAKKVDAISTSSSSGVVGQGVAPKKMTWASIASQPAKPQPKSLKSKMSSSVLTGSTTKHLPPASMDAIGTWESKNGSAAMVKTPPAVQSVAITPPTVQSQRSAVAITPSAMQSNHQSSWASSQSSSVGASGSSARQTRAQTYNAIDGERANVNANVNVMNALSDNVANNGNSSCPSGVALPAHPVLDKLRIENNYNPKEFDLNPKNARFFIIKSYSEDDIHRSIKYSIWCSTEHGNKRLDGAFKQQDARGPIYLLFSVNGSGHFCGMAQMMSSVDYQSSSSVWAQDKWKGQFRVRWIYVKDVPNAQLRHIRLENNENKPVTNSRDTQEVPFEKGKQVIKIMHHYKHTTSIFDDFLHYEKRQEEESQRRFIGDTNTNTNANTNANVTAIANTNTNGPNKKWPPTANK